jgi:hypothetical protein
MRGHVTCCFLLSIVALAYGIPAYSQEEEAEEGASNRQACAHHGKFETACNPFGTAALPHTIDNTCGMTGDATSKGDQAQDRQKNNLCAKGAPRLVTISDLRDLQDAVDKSGVDYGSTHTKPPHAGPPADRSTLFSKLPPGSAREGDRVSFVGFVVEAKKGSSETVNCHCTEIPSVDVHIALADHQLNLKEAPASAAPAAKKEITESNDAALCANSFVAETIPHKRPSVLELAAIEPLRNKIVKVTGQLFFDGSHRPCKGASPGSGDPARLTVFEIHPVYDIEVCSQNSLAQCTTGSSNWKSVLRH